MASYNNRKSLVGFVLVAVVLAGLLFGGIYLSKNNLGLMADDSRGPAGSEVSDNGNKSTDSTADKKTDETTQKAPETNRPDTDKSATTKKDESTSKDQSTGGNKTTDSSALPQTGPTEDFISLLGLGAMAASTVTYYRSRRNRLGAF